MPKKKKKKKHIGKKGMKRNTASIPIASLRSSEDVCKNCVRFGKDERKAGICVKTEKHTARNNSCPSYRKKQPSKSSPNDSSTASTSLDSAES